MAHSLYRKWRPQRWEDVVGQDAVVRTLRQAVRTGRVAHAYLFAGPRGTGKTTTARILAKALNCQHPDPAQRPCTTCEVCQAIQEGRFLDLMEIDAASHTSVDDVRALRETVHFAPTQGRYKVYIIDEVHMLSTAAFNALLKTLEEPPRHVVFVLATTEWHKVPATVRSRCQVYPFRRIPLKDMVAYLKRIVQAEGLHVEEDALRVIAQQATGSLRDAIALLDQLSALGETITLEHVHALLGSAPDEAVYRLVEALHQGRAGEAFQVVADTVYQGVDPRALARQVVAYLRQILLVQFGLEHLLEASDVWRSRARHHARGLATSTVGRWMRLFLRAATSQGVTWYPTLPLEMAVLEALYGEALTRSPAPASAPTPTGTTGTAGPAPATPSPTSAGTTGTAGPAPAASPPDAAAPAAERGPAPSGPPADPAPLTPEQVHRAWPQVRAWLANNSREAGAADLPGLLYHVQVLGAQGRRVILGVSGALWKQRFERDPYRTLWHQAWSRVLGGDVQVEWRVLSEQTGQNPPQDLPPLVAIAVQLGGRVRERMETTSRSATTDAS